MTEAVSIEYKLGEYGWSSFQLTIGTVSTHVGPFGYCTDALGDLVRAALMVATSVSRAEVSFDGEPREWRLIVEKEWGMIGEPTAKLGIKVLVFPHILPRAPDSEGEKVFEAYTSPDAFAGAVLDAVQRLWDANGAEGYNRAWNGFQGFPLRGLQALRAALSVEEPPRPIRPTRAA